MATMQPMTVAQFAAVTTTMGTAGSIGRSKMWGGSLVLRQISSLQEAAVCGGILIYDPASQHAVGLVGLALRRWLAAGGGVPAFVLELGYDAQVGTTGGYADAGSTPGAPANFFEYNKWHLEPNSTLSGAVYCGLVSTADTGFFSTGWNTESVNPFTPKAVLGLRIGGVLQIAPTPSTAVAVTKLSDGDQFSNTFTPPQRQPFGFLVTTIPFVESMQALLRRIKSKVVEGAGSSQLQQAWSEIVPQVPDFRPPLRTIWAYVNGAVHHGGGGPRVCYGTTAMLRAVAAARKLAVGAEGRKYYDTGVSIGWDGAISAAEYRGPWSTLESATKACGSNFKGTRRNCSGFYSVLPFGPAMGDLGLPAAVTWPAGPAELSMDLLGLVSGNSYNGPYHADFTLEKTVDTSIPLASSRAGDPRICALPTTGTVGTVGTTDMATLHRSSLVGQVMSDDGTKAKTLAVATWQDFIFSHDLSPEQFETTLVPSGDTQVDTAALVGYGSAGVNSAAPKVSWMAWGPDMIDQVTTICDAIYDRAIDLAKR